MTIEIMFMIPGEPSPEDASLLQEFETLITRLDLHYIRPPEWRRLVAILARATLEAGDVERGQQAYDLAEAKWKTSRWYDGSI